MSKLILTLPCNQSHKDMKVSNEACYCSNCEKSLIDIRQHTETEIKQIIASNPGKVCGIFHHHQISSKISHVALSHASYRVGLSLLGILGFLGPIISSCEPAPDDATVLKQQAFHKLKFSVMLCWKEKLLLMILKIQFWEHQLYPLRKPTTNK